MRPRYHPILSRSSHSDKMQKCLLLLIQHCWNNWALCWWYLIRDNQVGKRPLCTITHYCWTTQTSEAPFVEPGPTAVVDTRKPVRYVDYWSCMDTFKLTAIECGQVVSFTASSLQIDCPCCGNTVAWNSLRRLCFGEFQSKENPAGLGWYDWTGPVIYPALASGTAQLIHSTEAQMKTRLTSRWASQVTLLIFSSRQRWP